MAGMLYLVPTPIGNLGDISKRARETLESADFIAAEDTRVTLKLLNHLELKKPLVSYYGHEDTGSHLQQVLQGRKNTGPDPGRRNLCSGLRRRKPRHLRPRRGPGQAVRRCRHSGLRHSRPLRRHHRPEHFRPAHRPVLL